MKIHVLPGDAFAESFKDLDIEGEVVVCRECMIEGPASAPTLAELWSLRADHISSKYDDSSGNYEARVAAELEKLRGLPAGSEVNLWFENELFCYSNMWFCLFLLSGTQADVYRVTPPVDELGFWTGFHTLTGDEILKCLQNRKRFEPVDLKLAEDLWEAYSTTDHRRLLTLAERRSDCFPHLNEICNAEIDKASLPKRVVQEIIASGADSFEIVFAQFTKRLGVYGYGDAQVRALFDEL